MRRRRVLRRRLPLRSTGQLSRRTPLARTAVSAASPPQRRKVAELSCLVCGEWPVDPAHLVPRSLGGCDERDCVVPLCRIHHRLYDRGELELLPYLEPRWRRKLAHGLIHLGLVGVTRRVTGRAPR